MSAAIEAEVAAERQLGLSRYEIYAVLGERRPDPPSPSAICRALKLQGLNRHAKPMPEEKRRIIRQKAGELGHVDLHRLPRDLFLDPPKGDVSFGGLICTCTRLAWAEVIVGKKALAVMFPTLKALNTLHPSQHYRKRIDPQVALRMRLKELAVVRGRYGYCRLHILL